MFAKLVAGCLIALVPINAASLGYGASLCHTQGYTCYVVKHRDSWERLFPDDNQRDLVKRINRMNTPLYSGLRIAIPTSHDTNILAYSPFPQQVSAPGTKFIYVSIAEQAFAAYNSDGVLAHWGPVSTALGYCPDIGHGCHTPTGRFAIEYKEGEGCISTKFPVGRGGAKMPYCMFFHGGFALHGSYELPGYNASHGCVRMFVDDAEWLNEEFTTDQPHIPVIIH